MATAIKRKRRGMVSTKRRRSRHKKRRSTRRQRGGAAHLEEQYNPVVTYKQKSDKLGDPDMLDVTTSLDTFKEETEA
jgi:hypothetical protein